MWMCTHPSIPDPKYICVRNGSRRPAVEIHLDTACQYTVGDLFDGHSSVQLLAEVSEEPVQVIPSVNNTLEAHEAHHIGDFGAILFICG